DSPFRVDIELTDASQLSVRLQIDEAETANRFTVHWGDGTTAPDGDFASYVRCSDCLPDAGGRPANGTSDLPAGAINHTFAATGTYSVVVRGEIAGWEDLRISSAAETPTAAESTRTWKSSFRTLRAVGSSGGKLFPFLFQEATSLMPEVPQTAQLLLNYWTSANSTQSMFEGCCQSLTELDVSSYETSMVTSMSRMFQNVSNLVRLPGLGNWASKVAEVTDLSYTFSELNLLETSASAGLAANYATTALNDWQVGKVKTLQSIFQDTPLAHFNVAKWDVSQVTDLSYAFANARAFDPAVGDW
ncbi:unnamed protein product, partial [Amoebophrya sp. A120]